MALDVLAQALRAQGFQPLPRELPVPAGLGFVGAKDHWGSVATCALAAADGLRPEGIARLAADFHALVQAQVAHAGSLAIVRPLGRPADVRLGSFGVLALVFERGCPPGALAAARAAKRVADGKATTLVWAVDAPLRKVHPHKGLPFGVVPKARDLEAALGA